MSEEEEVSEKVYNYLRRNEFFEVRKEEYSVMKASGSYCDKILMLFVSYPFHQLLSTLLKYSIICPSHSIATFIF